MKSIFGHIEMLIIRTVGFGNLTEHFLFSNDKKKFGRFLHLPVNLFYTVLSGNGAAEGNFHQNKQRADCLCNHQQQIL